MSKRPASAYRDVRGQAYTRKEYMGGVPASHITQFDQGDPNGDFGLSVNLVAKEACQIRHVALEAARISANRYIQKMCGQAYHLKIRVFPHQVLRENKLAVGAGADRISDGMRASFGTAVGTAARVKRGQKLITIRTHEANVAHAKEALRKAGIKLPTPCSITEESSPS